MTIEAALAENTAAVKTLAELMSRMLASGTPLAETKTAEKPAPVVETQKPAPVVETATDAPAQGGEVVTFDMVRKAVLELVKVRDKAVAAEVLSKFNVAKASELTEDQWADAYFMLNEASV